MSSKRENMTDQVKEVEESKVAPEDIGTVRDVTEGFKDIVLDSPLIGDILLNLEREITDKIPTLAVAPTGQGGFKMMVNKNFFNSLEKDEHRKAVIFHEIQHIVQKVFRRFMEQLKNQGTGYLVNLAADCSINQYNKYELPEGCVTLESLQELINSRGSNIVLKEKETSEYYFKALQDEVEKREKEIGESGKGCPDCGEDGSGNGQPQQGQDGDQEGEGQGQGQGQDGDQEGQGECPTCGGTGNDIEKALRDYAEKCNSDHESSASEMDNLNPLDQAAMDNIIKKAIDKQKQHDLKRGTGSGGSMLDILPTEKIKLHKKIWENFINKVIDGECPSNEDFDIVYGKPNRRSAYSVYGKKRQFIDSKLFVIMDTSASVSDRELQVFLSHVNKALKGQELKVTIIHCDWEVEHVDLNVKRISKKKGISVHGRGGTRLTTALDWIEEREGTKKELDILLFSDGETDWKETPKKWNVSAVYTPQHSKVPGIDKYAVLDIPQC